MGRGAILFLISIRTLFNRKTLDRSHVIEDAPLRPRHLSLEVTNLCNANCTFCAYQYQTRPIKFMPLELFKTAIDQYAAVGGGPLGLTPIVGDALIDKDLEKKVAYARSQPLIKEIGITTNAILLTRQRYESLVESGITRFEISMTGFDRAEYLRIYRNDSYEKIRANLLALSTSAAFKKCPVTLSLRTDAWLPFLKPDYWRFKNLGFKISSTFFFDNWSGKIQDKDLTGRMMIRPSVSKKLPCRMLYSGPTVLADGRITACGCRDVNGDSELIVGKIPQHSVTEAWMNGTMKKLRQRFLDQDLPDICKDCRHYNPVNEADLVKEPEHQTERNAA